MSTVNPAVSTSFSSMLKKGSPKEEKSEEFAQLLGAAISAAAKPVPSLPNLISTKTTAEAGPAAKIDPSPINFGPSPVPANDLQTFRARFLGL